MLIYRFIESVFMRVNRVNSRCADNDDSVMNSDIFIVSIDDNCSIEVILKGTLMTAFAHVNNR